MAGHNKWSKIRHTKGVLDAKRGKTFSKISKEITLAVMKGGAEVDLNPSLRQAIALAKSSNMPKDKIEKAIKKGSGELVGDVIEEVFYEGYAPGACAIIVHVATDNLNRSAAEIRLIFSKNGGKLGEQGSVMYQFDECGEIVVSSSELEEDSLFELAVEAGADDLEKVEDNFFIYTKKDVLNDVVKELTKLSAGKIDVESQELVFVAKNEIEVEDKETSEKLDKLCSSLEDYEDTLKVYTNFILK